MTNLNEIYLDNAATTRCDDDVASLISDIMVNDYGNPSSAHLKGMSAEMRMKEATERIAKTLRCTSSEILFTSGGTESDNLALIGGAYANRRKGNRVITSCFEHPAVLKTAERLENEGFDVVYLPVGRDGIIDMEALKEALSDDTILVSIMAVNNEIGSVQPLEEIGKKVKSKAPNALFHTDAVQGYGKVPINVKESGIDLLSVSAHKIHGPKGVGFLYMRNGVRLIPQISGGGQQRDLRSGTENVPGIAGLGLAAFKAFERFDEDTQRMRSLREYFCNEILSKIHNVKINGGAYQAESAVTAGTSATNTRTTSAPEKCTLTSAPHIISLSVKGVRAEVLLHALEEKNIFVSSGSACSSKHHTKGSKALTAIGLEEELLDSTIRLSLSRYTTKEELDYTLEALGTIISKLRKYVTF